MESIVVESASWRCVEAVPAILFSLEPRRPVRLPRSGAPSIGGRGRGAPDTIGGRGRGAPDTIGGRGRGAPDTIAVAEGRATLREEGVLVLDADEAVTLRYTLPPVIDLRPLVGRFVRATLRTRTEGGREQQLLTLADDAGRVRLVAHFGRATGEVHVLGATALRAALSQRPGGPMVFGTAQLQYLVRVGERVTVQGAEGDLVMHFAARTAAGEAAYVIVDRALFAT